jgi:hypothetical protein
VARITQGPGRLTTHQRALRVTGEASQLGSACFLAAERMLSRPGDTPIWKLGASLKCRSCRKRRHAPPVRIIKLTERQETTA